MDNCNVSSEPTLIKSHNLPALYAFYGDRKTLSNLTKMVKNQKNIPLSFPDIKIIDKNFSDVLEKSQKLELPLLETAKAVKNNKPIYSNDVSKLADDLGYIVYPIVNKTLQFMVGLLGVAVAIALVLSIRNYYLLLLLVSPTEQMMFNDITTLYPNNNQQCWLHKFAPYILFFLFSLLTVIILIISFRFCAKSSHNDRASKVRAYAEMYIAFYDDISRVAIKLMTVPHAISDLSIETQTMCPRPVLKRRCTNYYIKFEWCE